MMHGSIRRLAVVVGVVASLVLGVATIRASATWTAAAAPLAVAPASVESLTARLADEEARSSDLQRQLDAVLANGAELTTALDAAQTRFAIDATTASDLRTRLAAAKSRLAGLEASLARARAAAPAAGPAAPATGAGGGSRESEGESDG